MKKKIALLLILVLVVTFAFTGCSMVKLNQDRDDDLHVADITYNGLTDYVSKKELKQFFNTQGYYLVAYYGMSPEEAYDYCADSLSQQKLSKLMAKHQLCKDPLDPTTILVADHEAIKAGTDSTVKNIFSDVLFVDEQLSIIKNYNKQMQELLDNFVKEVEKEIALQEEVEEEEKPEEEKEEDKKDAPAIRAQRPKAEDKAPEIKADSDYSAEELAAKKAELKKAENKRFEIKWAEEASKHTENQIEAKKRMDARVQKIYRPATVKVENFSAAKAYDIMFEELVNNMLVSHYRLTVVNHGADSEVNAVFETKKAEIIKANKDAFVVKNQTNEGEKDLFLESKYKAAITGGSPVLYHPIVGSVDEFGTTGYGYTLNILLKFDTKTEQILKDYKEIYGAESTEYTTALNKAASEIKVNISNPDYDPKAKCVSENKENQNKVDKYGYHDCREANCPLKPFIEYDVPVVDVLKRINDDLKGIDNTTFDGQVKLIEEFTKWMYLVNDDPGMFSQENAKGYLVAKTGASDYVEAYTEQSRKLMGATIPSDKTKEPTYANPTFDKGGKHFVGNYKTGEVTDTTDLSGYKNMIAITDFGIHIIMISSMPGYYQTNGILNDDSMFSYDRTSYVTVEKTIKDTIRNSVEANIYENNAAVKDLVDNYDKYVKLNKEVYKKLVEDVK